MSGSVRCLNQKHASTAVILALWLFATGYGLAVMWRHGATPGVQALAPLSWPADAAIRQGEGRWTLVMFNHPQCPCSRAGIGELGRILARIGKQVDTHILFYLPSGESEEWARTNLWRSATAIPGVQAIVDPGGKAAAKFGATTSGQVLLYNASGRLVFKGGVTAGRGHAGDSAGQEAIVSLVGGAAADFTTAPVFGCSLKEL